MALAHHLSTVIFHMLANGSEYVELGADYYDQRNKPKVVARLVSRLSRLGYYAELRPIGPPVPDQSLSAEYALAATPIDRVAAHSEPDPAKNRNRPVNKRKPGRPCKCAERGIICRHRTGLNANPLIQQPSSRA
jgi:hypothetical protein